MSKVRLAIILLALVVLGLGYYYYSSKTEPQDAPQTSEQTTKEPLQPKARQDNITYITLTGDEYKQLFLDSSHPNTKDIVEPPVITGDVALDNRIIALAEARGYELQQVPSSDLIEYEGHKLQKKLADAWATLKEAALKENIVINIESGLRTVEDQRQLFLERLGSLTADADISRVLATTAPPGYSRHHSGYVIDISDASATVFEYSPAFAWLSAGNYLVPKKLGIIPSYPDGAKNQGPEPEPWEYVWVGEQLLIQQ